MTSIRHKGQGAHVAVSDAAGPGTGSRPVVENDRVLDAARDCVLAVGVRRTTLTDVARRAGVSRMTLYRRWPDVRTLVGDLMTREWVAVATGAARTLAVPGAGPTAGFGLTPATPASTVPTALGDAPDGEPGGGTVRERLVGELVAGARAIREHPLMRKIIDVDPELLLPYMLDRRGASQKAFLHAIEASLREGHADGSVRPGHPVRQARSVLLIVQSFTLSLRTMTEASDPELGAEAFDGELGHLLDRALRP